MALVVRLTLLLRRERGSPRGWCMAQLVKTIRVLFPGRSTTRVPDDDGVVRPPLQGLVLIFVARLPVVVVSGERAGVQVAAELDTSASVPLAVPAAALASISAAVEAAVTEFLATMLLPPVAEGVLGDLYQVHVDPGVHEAVRSD